MVENLDVYPTVQKWMNKLQAKSRSVDFDKSSTRRAGLYWLKQYCKFLGTDPKKPSNPETIIRERTEQVQSNNITDKRQHEEFVGDFIIHLKNKESSPNTVATAIGLVRSFYKANYLPLIELPPTRSYTIRPFKIPTIKDIKKMCAVADAETKAWILCQFNCLRSDTYIHLENGELRKISEVKSSSKIMSANSLKPTIAVIGNTIQKMHEETFTVKTPYGKIVSSGEHMFYTYKNGLLTWKKAKDLTTNDYLIRLSLLGNEGEYQAIPKLRKNKSGRQCGIVLPETLTEDFAQVLGYFAGDGCLITFDRPEVIDFTDKSQECLENYLHLLKRLFPTHCPSIKRRERQRLNLSCTLLSEYFKDVFPELVQRSRARSIPQTIQRSPNTVLARFLRGIFDAEACVAERQIIFATTSEEYSNQIPLLLLRFGIFSNREEKVTQSRVLSRRTIKGGLPFYRIIITGENLLKYREQIGFSHPIKELKLKKIEIDRSRTDRNLVVPISSDLLKRCIQDTKKGLYPMLYPRRKKGTKYCPKKGSYSWFSPSRHKVRRILAQMNEKMESYSELQRLIESNMIAERVTKIQVNKEREMLYDLWIPSTSKYFANGFLVHNSGLGNTDLLSLSLANLSSEYGTIGQQLRKGTVPIHVEIRRQKTGERTHSFFGPNAINALKDYVNIKGLSSKIFKMQMRTVQQRVKALGIKAKISTQEVPVTPYVFRKAFNSFMKFGDPSKDIPGVNEAIVELMMGHSIGRVRSAYLVTGQGSTGTGIPISKLAEIYMKTYPAIDINLV